MARKAKPKMILREVVLDPLPCPGLPIALDNPWKSLGQYSHPNCHEWQRGDHIDSLAR